MPQYVRCAVADDKGTTMKYALTLCMAFVFAVALVGCGSGSAGKAEPADAPAAADRAKEESVASSKEDTSADEFELKEGQDAPEYLVPASLKNATPVTLYYSHYVDGADVVYQCATVNLPSALEVDEVATLESRGSGEFYGDDETVGRLFADFADHVTFLVVEGDIAGTRPETDHELTVSCTVRTRPFAIEGIQNDFPKATVKEISVGDATGFIVMPDPAVEDTGLVSANVFLNVGTIDDGYDTKYFTVSLYYSGGVMSYADVDFGLLEKAVLQMLEVDFGKVA